MTKHVISEHPPYYFDDEALIIHCDEVTVGGLKMWRFHCPHCDDWHYHGPGSGHRLAHCVGLTAFSEDGHNLASIRVD